GPRTSGQPPLSRSAVRGSSLLLSRSPGSGSRPKKIAHATITEFACARNFHPAGPRRRGAPPNPAPSVPEHPVSRLLRDVWPAEDYLRDVRRADCYCRKFAAPSGLGGARLEHARPQLGELRHLVAAQGAEEPALDPIE